MKRKAPSDETPDSVTSSYLKNLGLHDVKTVAKNQIVHEAFHSRGADNLSLSDLQKLFTYRVPKGVDGACSRKKEKEEDLPIFNLASQVYGLEITDSLASHPLTTKLYRLSKVSSELAALTKSDWLGIYKVHAFINGKAGVSSNEEKVDKSSIGQALVKEAYIGEYSRAIFPLTEEFAKGSNNSYVGLYKTAKVIKDVEAYDGPYYECSTKVKSELCVPIITPAGDVVGIIDAESWEKEHYSDELIAEIVKVAQDLAFIL